MAVLPPLHEDDAMDDKHFNILMVSTEAVPFVKEGGVADVMPESV